jgi:hypothetical protein
VATNVTRAAEAEQKEAIKRSIPIGNTYLKPNLLQHQQAPSANSLSSVGTLDGLRIGVNDAFAF